MKQRSMFGRIRYHGTRRGLAAWEKRSFPVSIRNTHDLPDVPGFVETECPGLGINKVNVPNPKGKYDWVVTHLRSGRSILSTPTRKKAQSALLELCQRVQQVGGASWDVEPEDIEPGMRDVAWEVRRKYSK